MTQTDPNTFPYTLIPTTPVTTMQRDAHIRQFTMMGDPVTDTVVGMFGQQHPAGESRALFEPALTHGITTSDGCPAELVRFLPIWKCPVGPMRSSSTWRRA
ncbi:hypothetical protein AB0C34_17865 [Nocardia sp. NPDC049220]|uniref:hypothetical protein n=1 Tax=Nocardia sp. NPDC049220 TaxID=3155273 RepID=UPI0033EAEA5E